MWEKGDGSMQSISAISEESQDMDSGSVFQRQ